MWRKNCWALRPNSATWRMRIYRAGIRRKMKGFPDEEERTFMSKPKLKPLQEQVIVITGASSGIGLATAELAAERGAKVVLSARSREATSEIVDRINAAGGEALFVPCDVTDRSQVEQLVQKAI